jgi:uncharacterized protein involved in exopolysaccharide biosynthesis
MKPIPTRAETPPDEIPTLDPSRVLKFFRKNYLRIALFVAGFAGVGVVHALIAMPEYTSEVRFMPELRTRMSGDMGQLSSLAGLAGINLGSVGGESEAVRPDLYPIVLQSTPFLLHIMQQKVVNPTTGQAQPLEEYLPARKRDFILGKVRGLFQNSSDETSATASGSAGRGTVPMNARREDLAKDLANRILTGMDRKTGIVSITVKMPDPTVAARVAQLTTAYLTNYVVSYRTEKARRQADFLKARVAEAKRRYQGAEVAYQSFRDRNRNPFLNVAQIGEDRLKAEFTLTQSVYNELSRQYEQARVKVQEETPVFKELEPPRVPNRKSEPARTSMVLVYALAGFLLGTAWAAVWKTRNEK